MTLSQVLVLLSVGAAIVCIAATAVGGIALVLYGIRGFKFLARVRRECPAAHQFLGAPNVLSIPYRVDLPARQWDPEFLGLLASDLRQEAEAVDRLRGMVGRSIGVAFGAAILAMLARVAANSM